MVYTVYGLGGRGVSRKRSRLWEIASFGLAACLIIMWGFALATNYSANIGNVAVPALLVALFVTAGMFFRHVRVRSALNAHYLQAKRSGS
jgi:hypothetical protein